MFEKIWSRHVVAEGPGGHTLLYVDRHLLHDGSPEAFRRLRAAGRTVRRPGELVATADHYVPTGAGSEASANEEIRGMVEALARNSRELGITHFGPGDVRQGIVHVIGPEQGLTQPGIVLVCGDSHTATHGAFGALAFGIGSTEVEHVLATQCLWQRKPKVMRITVNGTRPFGVAAKDVILAIIARIGAAGGVGHAIEYAGPVIRGMSMEERMTVCNMSIEAGARAGMIAPDDTTFEYLADRPRAPKGAAWDRALLAWRALRTDAGAGYDRTVEIDGSALEPRITFGTNPSMSAPIRGEVPDPGSVTDAADRAALDRALRYMGLRPGQPLLGHPVDVVFIGSCTNSRIEDLRAAASVLRGRKVAHGVRTLVVPGSRQVKRAAEAEGLDRVFREAGAEWREPGCSMCIAMNGDQLRPGQSAVSTSNRNFEGRQGAGGRTFLASPLTAAASALAGAIADPREILR